MPPTPSLIQTLPTRDQTRNQPQNQEGIYFPHVHEKKEKIIKITIDSN